jgi:hypothetical protein
VNFIVVNSSHEAQQASERKWNKSIRLPKDNVERMKTNKREKKCVATPKCSIWATDGRSAYVESRNV